MLTLSSKYTNVSFFFIMFLQAKPKVPFLKKYSKQKTYSVLELNQIQGFGKQILGTLKYLHEKGLPYGK